MNGQPAVDWRGVLVVRLRELPSYHEELGQAGEAHALDVFATVIIEAQSVWGSEAAQLQGDEAILLFQSPRPALECALNLQREWPSRASVLPLSAPGLAIGIDYATPPLSGHPFLGYNIVRARRICDAVGACGILANGAVTNLIGVIPGARHEETEPLRLRGIHELVRTVEVTTDT